MHPSYNGYAVLGTLKIVNLILWTFWTHARSIPILLSISASLLNGYAMVKEAFKLIALLSLSRSSKSYNMLCNITLSNDIYVLNINHNIHAATANKTYGPILCLDFHFNDNASDI